MTPMAYLLFVILLDIEHIPQNICLLVRENVNIGTAVGAVPNVDFSDASFFLSGGEYQHLFRVDTNSGFIFTANEIDREEICLDAVECTINLEINKTSPTTSELLNTTVTILDLNDNEPTFSKSVTTLSVQEDAAVGTTLMSDKGAIDKDAGINSALSYSLSGESFKFNLQVYDLGINLILLKPLDYEVKNHYTLLIIATDDGLPRRTGTLSVAIFVIDVNDNYPMFSQANVTRTVLENVSPGTKIPIDVDGAIDQDTGVYGDVNYFLIGVSDFELAHDNSGNKGVNFSIILNGSLDYETKSSYNLQLIAIDGGAPPLTGTLLINIIVVDVNDNPPVFMASSYSVTIFKSYTANSTIMHISAVDYDSGNNGKISYFLSPLQDPATLRLFDIDETTGILKVIDNLQNEKTQTFVLRAKARDNGQPSLESEPITININLLDLPSTYSTEFTEKMLTSTKPTKPKDEQKDNNGHGSPRLWWLLILLAVCILLLFVFIYLWWRARRRSLRKKESSDNQSIKSPPEVPTSNVYDEIDSDKMIDSRAFKSILNDIDGHLITEEHNRDNENKRYTEMPALDSVQSEEYTKMYAIHQQNSVLNSSTSSFEPGLNEIKRNAEENKNEINPGADCFEKYTEMNAPDLKNIESNINATLQTHGLVAGEQVDHSSINQYESLNRKRESDPHTNDETVSEL